MRHAVRLTVAATVVVAAVAMVAVAPATAQSADELSITISADDVDPGENLTASFAVENTGDEPFAVVIDVTELPDDWELQSHDDDGATWRSDQKWLFQTVESGDSVEPSLTVAVPNDASGEYTIAGNASTTSAAATNETTVTVGEEVETSSGFGPGFGPVVAVIALLAAALLAHRRR